MRPDVVVVVAPERQLAAGVIKRFVRLMSSSEWLDQLARIECPTLIVAPGGTAGNGITSLDQYRRMQELIPHAKLVVYEGLPHHISDAVPQRCVRDLIAFLENLPMR